MREGYLVAKDSAGNPSLLADCRTPIWEQEKQLRMIKSDDSLAPDWADSIDLICTERGIIMRWLRIGKSVVRAESKPETKTSKKGSPVKHILGLFVAFLLLTGFASNAQAQYAAQTLSGFPATLAAATATNLASAPVMDVRKQNKVAVQVKFTLSAAATTNTIYTFARSVDGSNFDTSGTVTWQVPQNGTTAVICSTNIDMEGYGYLKLLSIDNRDDNGVLTNSFIKYAIKRGAD